MAKVFITGVTGFLGSNIAAVLLSKGHRVIANYRKSSSKELCREFEGKITWILQDEDGAWVNKVSEEEPEVIIHSAWLGVGHLERNDWEIQQRNIDYLQTVLSIAGKSETKQFIGLGSQAEYGVYSGCIDENYPTAPNEAYGRVKLICTELLKQYATQYGIDWYWLRLFSFFGKGEADNWLIPSLVKKLLTEKEMDLTAGEQKYSYLYVNDLGLAIDNIITKGGNSGIFNISGNDVATLRHFVESIRDKINSSFKLNFGQLPYRVGQPMHMQGNSAKFTEAFGEFDISDRDRSLSATLEYLKKKYKDQLNEGI